MSDLTHNVKDIDTSDRRALERLLGIELHEDQRVEIRVINGEGTHRESDELVIANGNRGAQLPDWCAVYDGLSDSKIAELEQSILQRANLSRCHE